MGCGYRVPAITLGCDFSGPAIRYCCSIFFGVDLNANGLDLPPRHKHFLACSLRSRAGFVTL